MRPAREPLPIDPHLEELLNQVQSRRSLILVAPPGSGKTTRLPPVIVNAEILPRSNPIVLLLQPRRVAARAAAARIASEQGWRVGEEVGYQIRFENRCGPRTVLRVVTEGILTRILLTDPFLEGVGAVILDEFHERSIHTDLAIALLREVRETVRDDLILVVMSATLDAEPISRFLGQCPIIRAESRPFPVRIDYRPAAVHSPLSDRVKAALVEILDGSDDPGHILIFLPGLDEIRRCARALEPLCDRADLAIMPLHGSLPSADQDRALSPSAHRKVILATNIAETSLTIDGVRTVIDSGLVRSIRHDPKRLIDRLELGRISQASATQRAGRAGRTGPGRCIRLWAMRDERGMPEYDEPEIRRLDLAPTLLDLHAWGQPDPMRFGWFEAPPADSIAGAERTLAMLHAIDPGKRSLTALGEGLQSLPVHPRLGRLLLGAAQEGLLREGATLAALLSEKDIVIISPSRSHNDPHTRVVSEFGADIMGRIDLLREIEEARFSPSLRSRGLDPGAARRVAQVRDQLLRLTRNISAVRLSSDGSDHETILRRLLLWAYPDRVAKRRSTDPGSAVMVGGRGVRFNPDTIPRSCEYMLVIDLQDDRRHASREGYARLLSMLEKDWLEESFPESIRRERTARFDVERGRVVGVSSTWYRDLLICEEAHATVPEDEASRVLAEALGPRALELIREDPAGAAWLDRLSCLREWRPDLDLPEFDSVRLAEMLADACVGRRSVEELKRAPWVSLLECRLSHTQRRALEELAPTALVIPSGNRMKIRYEPGRPPVLAARLQELFGWPETPRIAGGRVKLVVHILGPNFRPVQVTDDLGSFWKTTYFQVRKDLRGRYPKHAWPEDPTTARAEARGGRSGHLPPT